MMYHTSFDKRVFAFYTLDEIGFFKFSIFQQLPFSIHLLVYYFSFGFY